MYDFWAIFFQLDTSLDGYVDWNEFCTYMLLLYRENDYMRTKREIPFLVEPKLRHIVHNRVRTIWLQSSSVNVKVVQKMAKKSLTSTMLVCICVGVQVT